VVASDVVRGHNSTQYEERDQFLIKSLLDLTLFLMLFLISRSNKLKLMENRIGLTMRVW
jgi:hypothetical protein